MHTRRSALYVPVNHAGALAKTSGLDVDVLIYDLEDSLLPDQKHRGRKNLTAHLSASVNPAEVIVRINPLNSAGFYDDIDWLVNNRGIDGLLLPKVRNASEINTLGKILVQRDRSLPVWIMVETIDAILNLAELVDAMVPGTALVLGAQDLAFEMRIRHTPGRLGLLPVLTQLVLYGRQARLSLIDAVNPDIENELAFSQSCEQAKNLGFDGKTLIHPCQVATANRVFSPSMEEIKKAREMIEAWQRKPAHLGVASLDGQMILARQVEHARELLEAAGLTEDSRRS